MSYANEFNPDRIQSLLAQSASADDAMLRSALAKPQPSLEDFAVLISPAASKSIEELGRRSRDLTQQRFGKVIRLFAPLYLSNECVNVCRYCGFSRDNPILRLTLSIDEVVREARALKEQGFRNLLLVAGEHPKFVSAGYLAACVERLHGEFPSLSLEVGPMETPDYRKMVEAGAEGLVVYQETYDRAVYAEMHTAGPKKDFAWRLETPERACAGGFRRLGIGALFGLANWRFDALSVASHAAYLLKKCWRAQLTISLPRLRPCAGEFEPVHSMTDRELVQLVCAFRLFLPDVGLVLSTREPAALRDGLIPLGITMMSAGSHTEPGGYTGAGSGNIHLTKRGRIPALVNNASEWAPPDKPSDRGATGQFEIADARSPREIEATLRRLGYDPVWKDWDAAFAPEQAPGPAISGSTRQEPSWALAGASRDNGRAGGGGQNHGF